jgi:hypothetical protein
MARPDGRGWSNPPKLLKKLGERAHNLAERMNKNDPPEELLHRMEVLLARQIRLFGLDGGPTANARGAVAKQLERLGRLPEARLLREEILAAQRHHRGAEDPQTLNAELWLAINLRNQGLPEDARPFFVHVCEARRRVLGPDDEETVLADKYLASLDDRSGSD